MAEHEELPPVAQPEHETFDILPTGITGLDTVLGGGIPVGGMLLVVGAPGTGKTVLAQQICFNTVTTTAGRALFFSALSEPHDKLLRHLRPFKFYDANLLGKSVVLLALQEFLKQGLDATAEIIMRTTRQQKAQLVCIDGFRAIEAISQDTFATRQFLYQLSSQLYLLGATMVILLERDASELDSSGIFTIADGVVACYYDLLGVQRRRRVEVKKLRTMAHLHGLHSYRISENGWTVFPRIEELIAVDTTAQPAGARGGPLTTGSAELDRLLGGGLPRGSTTLIVGEPGVGKTVLGLHYITAGLQQGEPGMFLSFDERREQLIAKAHYFGLPLEEGERNGLLSIRTFAPVDIEPDEISSAIRQEVVSRGIKRLVIDATFEIERAVAREGRSYDYLAALVTYLRTMGVTVCMTKVINKQAADAIDFSDTPVLVVAENLLLLRQSEEAGNLVRALSVLKMRDGDPDRSPRTYAIGPGGLTIAGRSDEGKDVAGPDQ